MFCSFVLPTLNNNPTVLTGGCIVQSQQTARLFIQTALPLSIYGAECQRLPHLTSQIILCHDEYYPTLMHHQRKQELI